MESARILDRMAGKAQNSAPNLLSSLFSLKRPLVMGILNVTPDSFSDGGQFLDPAEARTWSEIYYGIIKSDQCVPLGHAVNANLAMVSNFSVHRDRAGTGRRVVRSVG